MKTMSEEVRKEFDSVWTENKNKQNSLSQVIKTTKAAVLRKSNYSVDALLYVTALRDEKKLMERVIDQMSHVTFNGMNKKTAVDYVHVDECDLNKYNRAIREYRVEVGADAVELKQCISNIEREEDVEVKVKFVHESGYVQELTKRDKDGKVVTEKQKVYLVPREKTVWGYTDTVKNAFMLALESIVNE